MIATLAWQRSSLATGETADQRWTFKREGFWHPQVTVRTDGSDQNEAVFRPSWNGGGSLERADVPSIRLGPANFWHSQWDWQLPDGSTAVHFKNRSGLLKSGADVEIEAGGRALPELPLLVVLGWYLLVLFANDAAAASAAATVATIN